MPLFIITLTDNTFHNRYHHFHTTSHGHTVLVHNLYTNTSYYCNGPYLYHSHTMLNNLRYNPLITRPNIIDICHILRITTYVSRYTRWSNDVTKAWPIAWDKGSGHTPPTWKRFSSFRPVPHSSSNAHFFPQIPPPEVRTSHVKRGGNKVLQK